MHLAGDVSLAAFKEGRKEEHTEDRADFRGDYQGDVRPYWLRKRRQGCGTETRSSEKNALCCCCWDIYTKEKKPTPAWVYTWESLRSGGKIRVGW